LLDEPLSNLDAALRVGMRIEIARLKQELASTMIYVTHDQIEAMTLADRIVVMNGGRIEQVGSPLELYEQPSNLFVAGFIGSPAMNFLRGRVDAIETGRARIRLALGPSIDLVLREPTAIGTEVTVGVRPEHVRIESEDVPGVYAGQAFVVEMLGSDTFVYMRNEPENLVIRDSHARRIRAGDPLTVSFPSAKCYVFGADGRRISAAVPVHNHV
jgi:multiple sugar transport system ATP-binding protein